MIFIDANIFLAYVNENDVHHLKAVSIFQEIESEKYGPYFTSDYVFNEIVGVALRKLGKEKAVLLGEQVLKTIFLINVDDVMLRESWKIFTTTKSHLSLVDCTNLALIRATGTEHLATFDKEFQNIKELNIVSS